MLSTTPKTKRRSLATKLEVTFRIEAFGETRIEIEIHGYESMALGTDARIWRDFEAFHCVWIDAAEDRSSYRLR